MSAQGSAFGNPSVLLRFWNRRVFVHWGMGMHCPLSSRVCAGLSGLHPPAPIRPALGGAVLSPPTRDKHP